MVYVLICVVCLIGLLYLAIRRLDRRIEKLDKCTDFLVDYITTCDTEIRRRLRDIEDRIDDLSNDGQHKGGL